MSDYFTCLFYQLLASHTNIKGFAACETNNLKKLLPQLNLPNIENRRFCPPPRKKNDPRDMLDVNSPFIWGVQARGKGKFAHGPGSIDYIISIKPV